LRAIRQGESRPLGGYGGGPADRRLQPAAGDAIMSRRSRNSMVRSNSKVVRAVWVLVGGIAVASCALGHGTPAYDRRERIPTRWVDLPDAPFVARMVGQQAVLINRTARTFDRVEAGCVRRVAGRVQVVGQLFATSMHDSAWTPGSHVDGLLSMVNNVDFYIADQKRMFGGKSNIEKCADDAHSALVSASYGAEYRWNAEGTPWPQ
jgi:hypothetical protein